MTEGSPSRYSQKWLAAATLKERLRLSGRSSTLPQSGHQMEAASRLVEGWRTGECFRTDASFRKRLSLYEASTEEVISAVDASVNFKAEWIVDPPDWFAQVKDSYHKFRDTYTLTDSYSGSQIKLLALYLLEPMLLKSVEAIDSRVKRFSEEGKAAPLTSESVRELFVAAVLEGLIWQMRRSLILEINIARLIAESEGADPAERLKTFTGSARNRESGFELLMEYPVLARQLLGQINAWENVFGTFLDRLRKDMEEIKHTFFPVTDIGNLLAIRKSGDTHKNGDCVVILTFESHDKLVYKPRSLAVDSHFQTLISTLNKRFDDDLFRAFKVSDQGSYGWTEYVPHHDCETEEQVVSFYRRQGYNMALMYALGGTDFNFENMIASGEYPVIIDVEALFRPARAHNPTEDLLYESVFGTGFLAIPQASRDGTRKDDATGFGNMEGKTSDYLFAVPEDADGDHVRIVRKSVVYGRAANLPTYKGHAKEVFGYASFVVEGFEKLYRLIWQHRDEFTAEGGLLTAFEDDETRVLMRHTREYSQLLDESFHPDLLQDAALRDMFFDNLWGGADFNPLISRIFEVEKSDLWNADVPVFNTKPNSRHVWTSTGERLDDLLSESGMDLVRRRISRLGEQDLQRQVWLLRTVFDYASGAPQGDKGTPLFAPGTAERHNRHVPQGRKFERDELITAAKVVGNHVIERSWSLKTGPNWFSIKVSPDGWALNPMDIFIYEGLAGPAIFFAYLGRVTGESSHLQVARQIVDSILTREKLHRNFVVAVGGFVGWGSVIYALTHLSATLEDPGLIDKAEEIAEVLPPLINKSEQFDVINGLAGCILSLNALYHARPSERTRELADMCGKALLEKASSVDHGIAWPTAEYPLPLAGFSHGAAGIALSLFKLGELTGNPTYLQAGRLATNYERTLFLPNEGAWADLRSADDSTGSIHHSSFSSWCNGATGIALARLRALPHLSESEVQDEVEKALANNRKTGFSDNHSLCHGVMGNIELLYEASTITSYTKDEEVRKILAGVLQAVFAGTLRCGTPGGVESSGLMMGLCGVGLGLLRAYDPEVVPSLLMLDPVKKR